MRHIKSMQLTALSGQEQVPKLKDLVCEFESALPSNNIAHVNQVKS